VEESEMMETGALIWDEKIYPREKKSDKTVDTYCEALNAGAEFPPIVNGVRHK